MSRSRLISCQEAVVFENWKAPVVEGYLSGDDSYHGRPPTARQLQGVQKDAHAEAYNKGLAEGRSQGYQEGKVKGLNEYKQQIDLLKNCIAIMTQPFEDLDDEVEQNLVELCVLIARQIIKREFRQDPGEIVAVIREAIKVLPLSSRHITIYLHPEDAELVKSALSLKDEDRKWSIEEDLSALRGDCRIETDTSVIDATIENRLSAIAANILGGSRDTDVRKPE